MADDRHIGNAVTRLPVDRFGLNLSGRISSCSQHVQRDAVTMVMPLPRNRALNV